MSSDSSAAVPTEVPEVQGEKPSVGPPPYNEFTVMEGEGVYCYKCHNYRTKSWSKLYTHLRLRCLDSHEKAVLVNSYLHVQANKELRGKAQAKRRPREPLASPPVVSESETQPTPPTGPYTLPDEVPRVPTSTPDVLSAAVLQQQSDSAESTPGALPAASSPTRDHTRCRVRYLPVHRRPTQHARRVARCVCADRESVEHARSVATGSCHRRTISKGRHRDATASNRRTRCRRTISKGRHRDATASNRRTRCSHSTAAIRCHRGPGRHVLDTDTGMLHVT